MDTHLDCPMLVRSIAANEFLRASTSFEQHVGFDSAELARLPFLDWIDPADQAAARDLLRGGGGSARLRHRTRGGAPLLLQVRVDAGDQGPVILGRFQAECRSPAAIDAAPDESTVRGALHTIARIVEEQNPGYRCSILLETDCHFVAGAGPSLPDSYNEAIDGYAVGPTVGSCGTAIFWNVPVIVEDIQADPLWTAFAELARDAGVAACWSHPFTGTSGRVLGALALYASEPSAPTAAQLSSLRAAARMTGLAVERGRAEEALREKRRRELELEEQLRQAAKMEALGVLAGGVAHDFNNVLGTILANAEFALRHVQEGTELADTIQDIIDSSRHAGGFCSQMLAYAGRGTVCSAAIELGAFLPQVNALTQAALPKKVTLEYRLHDQPIFVEGDENQLLQVVLNLVTNAAEAIGDEAGCITIATELVALDRAALKHLAPQADLPAGQYARLTVTDTGCGMDAETRERIFDPFFTTKFSGRGLGLAAVLGIIGKHQGAVHIRTAPGQGTSFVILLPTAEVPAALTRGPSESAPPRALVPKRILVVDDEVYLRRALRRALTGDGFDVVLAGDGQEAIDRLREAPDSIDCVLLDLSMPRLGGEEVLKSLRAMRDDIPVVLMSGYAAQEVQERFAAWRVSAVLHKPIPRDELASTLKRATDPPRRSGPVRRTG